MIMVRCVNPVIDSMGRAVRVAIATGGGDVGNYSMIVFTGWDYSCLGDQATKLKQKNIHYRLQVRKRNAGEHNMKQCEWEESACWLEMMMEVRSTMM